MIARNDSVGCCSKTLRISAAVALSVIAVPVFADDCRTYVSRGSTLEIRPEERGIVINGTERCFITGEPTGATALRAHCGYGDSAFFQAASEPGGRFDLLIFADAVWYENCTRVHSDPAPTAEAAGPDAINK
jgi:hypothetical protein